MRLSGSPYGRLAAAEFQRFSTYRAATLAGIFTNCVFGFIRVGVLWAAIGIAGGQLGGYGPEQASTYVWLGQAFLAPVAMYAWSDLADRVRTGDIGVDLARPVDLQLSWWARDLGRAGFLLPTRGLAPLLVGALTVGVAAAPTWTAYPLGLVSLALGISVSFLCRYGMNLIAFWTLDVRGYLNLYFLVAGLLGGFLLPVHLFPGWMQQVAFASPFPSMYQVPIDVTSGRVVGSAAWRAIAVQVGWVVVLVVVTRLALRRATTRLVVQGG